MNILPEFTSQTRPELPEVLTVSALNQSVAKLLEHHYASAWIAGEVSNFTKAASGHWYFTLKDSAAQVRALMFRGRAQSVDFPVREGDKIEVRATVTLYTARGDYQLNVEAIRHAGVGNLYEAFLRLKEKLAAEGLFDAERKRALPVFVRTIGIVTSPQAAALRDILTTLARRAPHVHIILYPTPVQGEAAVEKIVDAITSASTRAECDVLLVARGGGSMEDLWCFNDERIARAIVACSIPVISGVGHETDNTITDFVADLRAPTPTGAAEMATRTRADWMNAVQTRVMDMQYAMQRILSNSIQNMDSLARRLIGPTTYIEREKLKLHGFCTRLSYATHTTVSASQYALQHLHTRLKAKRPDTRSHHTYLSTVSHKISTQMTNRRIQRHQTLISLSDRLELLNPQRTLERGYAIITDKRGRVVRSPKQLHTNDVMSVRLAEGGAQVGIASVQPTLD